MNPAMIKKLQKIQREIEEIQTRIQKTEFSDSYQGVFVAMLGTKEVTRIQIDVSFFEDPSMKDMLEELLQIAINNVQRKIDKQLEEEMKPYANLAGGMGLGF